MFRSTSCPCKTCSIFLKRKKKTGPVENECLINDIETNSHLFGIKIKLDPYTLHHIEKYILLMDSRVKNKNASTQNSTYNFRRFTYSLKLSHGFNYLEEDLLIISIEISMSKTRYMFKIKSHATNEDEHI